MQDVKDAVGKKRVSSRQRADGRALPGAESVKNLLSHLQRTSELIDRLVLLIQFQVVVRVSDSDKPIKSIHE